MRQRLILIRAANWYLSFLYQIRRFQTWNLWYTFETLFAQNEALGAATFYIKVNYIWHEIWKWFRFSRLVFLTDRFFGGSVFFRSRVRSRSSFQRMPSLSKGCLASFTKSFYFIVICTTISQFHKTRHRKSIRRCREKNIHNGRMFQNIIVRFLWYCE